MLSSPNPEKGQQMTTATTDHTDTPQTPPTLPLGAPTNGVQAVQAPQAPAPQEALQGDDRAVFEVAKTRRQLSIKEAELALAKTETSESEFRCLLLRLYIKLGLNPEKDRIDENGVITRNFQQQKGS